jgi:hypothetical protein
MRARVTELEFVGGRRDEAANTEDSSGAAPAAKTVASGKPAGKAAGFDELDDDIPF